MTAEWGLLTSAHAGKLSNNSYESLNSSVDEVSSIGILKGKRVTELSDRQQALT